MVIASSSEVTMAESMEPRGPQPDFSDGRKKTACVLCAQNCGLEVLVENGRLVRSRPDKANPRSQGYICRKGSNIANFQHHAQRLTHPLKRVNGDFQRITWDQAINEIAAKLGGIVDEHGPRAFAFMGGGGQGSHMSAAFAVRLLRGLGSHYHYSALAQELTGMFWVMGRCLGRQYLATGPDVERTDMLVALGWNPWMSRQMPQARRHVARIQKDPDKLLVVIDPRRTATAERADIHLAVRPGTDALLLKAMLVTILAEDWYDEQYVANHVRGFDNIRGWFTDFEVEAALGEHLFQALSEHPEGIWVGRSNDDNLSSLRTGDGKINVLIQELAEDVIDLDASSEQAALTLDPEHPLVLVAGFRNDMNATTLMRNPEWNAGRRSCTVQIHPSDASTLQVSDGDIVRVATEAGQVDVEAEVTEVAHPGQVAIPHGFGLDYDGTSYGVNVNRLTPSRHRDPIAGTPLHKHVPCRVEALEGGWDAYERR
jgi:anaerobic selenocysteine-containing dehydrogenase